MKHLSVFFKFVALGLIVAVGARAAVLLQTSTPLTTSDPTQTGRLSRNNIQQDWSGGEPFPGVINPTTTYAYETFAVNVGMHNYIQIEMNDPSSSLFVSAYQTKYAPDSSTTGTLGFDTNWLGDLGLSGNYAFITAGTGLDPHFFQVVANPNSVVIVVINETSAGAGIGHPFSLTVEGFKNSEFGN